MSNTSSHWYRPLRALGLVTLDPYSLSPPSLGGEGESLIRDLKRKANSLSRETRQVSALGLPRRGPHNLCFRSTLPTPAVLPVLLKQQQDCQQWIVEESRSLTARRACPDSGICVFVIVDLLPHNLQNTCQKCNRSTLAQRVAGGSALACGFGHLWAG